MQQLLIERTRNIPYIEFNPDGRLKMEGRSLPEDVNHLFDPLIDYVSHLSVEEAIIDINLEYFNTATSKKLLEVMKNLELNKQVGDITVNWHYEEGDDDSVEMAEIYEGCLARTKFRHLEFEEDQEFIIANNTSN